MDAHPDQVVKAPQPAPRGRWWRKPSAALLLGALVLAMAGVAGELAGWPFLRTPLQAALVRASGVPVVLGGDFDLRLFGVPTLAVSRLTVGAANELAVPHLLDAQDVTLAWSWAAAWRWRQGGPLHLKRLHAHTLDANLLRLPDGRSSWALGRREGPGQTAAPPDAPLFTPVIETLVVDAGRITLDDALSDTQIAFALRGNAGAAAPGGMEATAAGRFRKLPLNLRAQAARALPLLQDGSDGAVPTLVPLRVQGNVGAAQVQFDGQAAALFGARVLHGQLHFKGPSLARVGQQLGVTLPDTPPFDLKGQISHQAGLWQLRAERATIGRSVLAGTFEYDSRPARGRLRGHLTGAKLMLADLGPAIGASPPGSAAPSAPIAPRRMLPQRHFDLPSLRAMDADVTVAIDELDFGSAALTPLRQVQARVVLDAGVLRLEGLRAAVAGGQVTGSTRLDATTDPPGWAARLHFAAVDLAGFVRGVRKVPVQPAGQAGAAALRRQRVAARQGSDASVAAYLTGLLTADVQAVGAGRSTAQILGSLDGNASASLHGGTLSHLVTELLGLDVAQALGVLVRGDKPLPLRCAVLDLALKDGVATARRGVIDNADSTVRLNGRINLRDETLALRATVRPKDVSPLSLRTPLLVTGTLADPCVGVEGGRLAGRVLAALGLAAIAGPAGLLPLLDTGAADQADPCVAAAAPARAATAAKS